MSEPTTEAGRRLLDWFGGPMKPGEERNLQKSILAIEREAVAAFAADIEGLRALSEAATPGPLVAGVEAEGWHSREHWRVPVGPGKVAATHTEADAALIVAAVNLVRALLHTVASEPTGGTERG